MGLQQHFALNYKMKNVWTIWAFGGRRLYAKMYACLTYYTLPIFLCMLLAEKKNARIWTLRGSQPFYLFA